MNVEKANKIADFNIGDRVMYTPWEGCPVSRLEYGMVTSINERYVFVRYDGESVSKSTRAEDLRHE